MNEDRRIADLFPPTVRVVSLCDASLAEPLSYEEEAAIVRAADRRRVEFGLGRTAARHALSAIGLERVSLPANPDGSVAWPSSVWGSITHCKGLCIAVAALRRHHGGVGVDAELRTRARRELWAEIANEHEIDWIEAAGDEAAARERATVLFSAKESFYKAQFCRSGRWVGFHDVELRSASEATFELELGVDVADGLAKGTRFDGRFIFTSRHVITGLVLPP